MRLHFDIKVTKIDLVVEPWIVKYGYFTIHGGTNVTLFKIKSGHPMDH